MPAMSAVESVFCRSAPWRFLARRLVLPWALRGHRLQGEVLEIGGGSGAMAAGAARGFPEAQLTVTDLDPTMVESARSALRHWPNVSVEVADVTSLPFPDGTFEVVTSYLMLHHVIDWTDALAEVARVLKPGGTFVGYDLTPTRLARWVHRADGSPHRIVAPGELAEALDGGFAEVHVRVSALGLLMRFDARKSLDD